jgi:hypothetical protein
MGGVSFINNGESKRNLKLIKTNYAKDVNHLKVKKENQTNVRGKFIDGSLHHWKRSLKEKEKKYEEPNELR